MAVYDSADLLARTKALARIPATATYPTDPDLYQFLTDTENRVKAHLGLTVPESQAQAPVLLTTADGGFTFTFGTDAEGNAVAPLGNVLLFARREDDPDLPLRPGVDFIPEGTRIRMPNRQRTSWPDGAPYARFITPTLLLSASVQPTLQPVQARELLPIGAAALVHRAMGDPRADAREAEFGEKLALWTATLQQQFAARLAGAGSTALRRRAIRYGWWQRVGGL